MSSQLVCSHMRRQQTTEWGWKKRRKNPNQPLSSLLLATKKTTMAGSSSKMKSDSFCNISKTSRSSGLEILSHCHVKVDQYSQTFKWTHKLLLQPCSSSCTGQNSHSHSQHDTDSYWLDKTNLSCDSLMFLQLYSTGCVYEFRCLACPKILYDFNGDVISLIISKFSSKDIFWD